MKRILISLLLVFVSLGSFTPVLIPSVAGAQSIFDASCKDPANTGADGSAVCQGRGNTGKNPFYGPDGVATRIVTILSYIIGIAAVIVIALAGMNYMLSSGDPGKISTAKNAIIYAVIGIVVALVAQSIVIFVLKKL